MDNKDIQSLKTPENKDLNKPRMNVFKNDALMNFAHKKTERITTALYMVTGMLPDSEPLKWKLREKGLDLMSHMLAFGSDVRPPALQNGIPLMTLIVEQISLLEVAHISGGISEMNFVVLRREYEYIARLLEKIKNRRMENGKDGYVLPRDFFELPHERSLVDLFEHAASGANEQKKTLEDRDVFSETNLELSKRNMSLSTEREIVNAQRPVSAVSIQNPRSRSRREAILSFLREHSAVSIKDISKMVRGCSEKTVQRELLALVRDGIVVKEGERRWSTYSLIS